MWKIKRASSAFFQRISMMLSEEEELEAIEKEIEAQHYFQPIFEKLRECPNDTLLSDNGLHNFEKLEEIQNSVIQIL